MYDASGKTIWVGDRVTLSIAYTSNGKHYPAGTSGAYRGQKAGAGFLCAIVQFGVDTLVVNSTDIIGMDRSARADCGSRQEPKKPVCPVCRSALEYYAGADDYCSKCRLAVRYMKT